MAQENPSGDTLKNFLRGMETERYAGAEDAGGGLKNFLRGMETGAGPKPRR